MRHFNFTPGPQELIILVVVGFFAVRAFGRRSKGSSDSIFRALAVTATILVAILMAGVMFYGSTAREIQHQTTEVSYAVSSPSSTTRVFTMANSPSLLAESDSVTNEETTTVHLQTTATTSDNEMLMLPLSNQVLAELIGVEGVRAIEHLNESVPAELRQAYAMIPIPGPGHGTVAPVLRGSLGPAIIQHGLSDKGLNIIQSVSGFLASTDESDGELTAEAAEREEYVAPDWVENPAEGYVVVKSEFVEPTTPSSEALRSSIEAALYDRVSELVSQKFGTDGGWSDLLDVSVTDAAIEDCVVETSDQIEVLETSVGTVPMRRTYALVNLPNTLQDGLANDVRKSLQHNRMTAVCVSVGILWLCAMLLSVVFRAGQSPSALRKLATVPMVGLLVIPCAVMFVAMTGAMLNGETFDFEWSKDRVACVIDRTTE